MASDGWHLVVASGPSLRRDDLELLRHHVTSCTAVNRSVFYAPWADVLFAGDAGFWRYYGPYLEWYKGRRVSRAYQSATIQRWRGKWPRTGGNSGHMAIQHSVDDGHKRIAIIGFDQQLTDGRAHNHADHPKTVGGMRTNMGNANGVGAWPRHMNATAVDLEKMGVEVINLTRITALRCFTRMTPEQFVEMVTCP